MHIQNSQDYQVSDDKNLKSRKQRFYVLALLTC